jgi:alkylhydroperoxidase/carboxymuconolactone decarboxylase family protein YurZ
MDEQTKGLIALGAAVASGCHHCIEQYVAKCDQLELSHQDVTDAINVGLSVRDGARDAMQKHAGDMLGHYPQEAA